MVSIIHVSAPTKTSSGRFYTNEYKKSKFSRKCVGADLNTILSIKVTLILHLDPQRIKMMMMMMMISKMMMMMMTMMIVSVETVSIYRVYQPIKTWLPQMYFLQF